MALKEPFASRIAALRRKMARNELAALLVTRPENRRYLSGYAAMDPQLDESSGCLLITRRGQYLLTDFRYRIQAEKEALGYQVQVYQSGPAQLLARQLKRLGITRMGFEEDQLTFKAHRLLEEAAQPLDLRPMSGLVEELRAIKDRSEIRRITRALRITEDALTQTLDFMKPGRSEIEVARYLEQTMVDLGAEGPAFESIVASGPHAALPHATPTQRKIRPGETIIIDCGARAKGYNADMTRTVVLGAPKPWIKRIYRVVRQAQRLAIRGIKPGLTTDQADALARDCIEQAGYGPNFGHSLGHGVGMATHEAPALSRSQHIPLQPGMIVTVEPGIYLEGQGGVRLEEMILITEKGNRLLNRDKSFYDWPA